MKKLFFLFLIGTLTAVSCQPDDEETITYEEPDDINVRNSLDDQAIQKYLSDNYLDNLGNIKAYSSTDDTDDNEPSLASMNPITLPSGVVYVVRAGAQPDPGTTIGSTDIITLMNSTMTYVAYDSEGVVSFLSEASFENTITGSGVPSVDPLYYYAPQDIIDTYNTNYATSYGKSFYEIEGFQEALQHFKAFDMAISDNYNLQGVIIVPSRAAFARDDHYYSSSASNRTVWKNRSFIFNFQVYKTTPRI